MNDGSRPAGNQGDGFAAAHPPVRRAGYGSAPPASRLLRIANATALRPALTPETSADPRARKRGQARACPARRAAHKASSPNRKSPRFQGIAISSHRLLFSWPVGGLVLVVTGSGVVLAAGAKKDERVRCWSLRAGWASRWAILLRVSGMIPGGAGWHARRPR